MTYALKSLVAGAMLAAALSPLAASAADSDAMKPEVPCSQAMVAMHGTMHGDAMHGDAMKGDAMKGDAMKGDAMKGDAMPGATIDKMFASESASHVKALMEMAKLEMRCGSDAKMKLSAQKAIPELQQILSTLSIF